MLVLLESGDCTFQIKGQTFDLAVGDVLLIPKDTWYQPHTQNGCSYQYFHFVAGEVYGKDAEYHCGRAYRYCEPIPPMKSILNLPLKSTADAQVREALSLCIDEMLKDAPESHLKMHLCFFSALVRLSERARNAKETQADQVKKYIEAHAKEKISLAEIATLFGYTKQHVIRIFKAKFGITPTAFIDCCRLEHAMLLLSESDMTVEAIALASGFEDANYFSRRFRKRFGDSPTAYRARLQRGV